MQAKQVVLIILVSALTVLIIFWGHDHLGKTYYYSRIPANRMPDKMPVRPIGFFGNGGGGAGIPDFTVVAIEAVTATVHISAKGSGPYGRREWAYGSGAVISTDGYIVTNDHVVAGADEVSVTLSNRRSFKAKVIGTDPAADLAVVKIDAQNLPFFRYGNPDDVRVGQWVLAVGYPLGLETTVTAGIVSAKGRTPDINWRQSQNPAEAFIQTDAAVNLGNSGGPLINADGQLIGINTALASPTGSYTGYSFAIPVNVVKKVVDRIIPLFFLGPYNPTEAGPAKAGGTYPSISR